MEYKYQQNTYIGLMCNGRVHDAVEYLESFPTKRSFAQKIRFRMTSNEPVKRSKNTLIAAVDGIYQAYYKAVFWQNMPLDKAENMLLCKLCELAGTQSFDNMENAEKAIGDMVRSQDYQFLGGKTQGYYGAYIWKNTKSITYQVELPHNKYPFTVKMMHGFISRSWLDFLTFGRLGSGGWAQEDGLYCVWRSYVGRTHTKKYRVYFLKHEAQHALDYDLFSNKLSTAELEYRAKLVELIYANNLSRFGFFVGEASAYTNNSENSHAIASHRLIGALSQRIFGETDIYDLKRWKGKEKQIKSVCMELYDSFVPHNVLQKQ